METQPEYEVSSLRPWGTYGVEISRGSSGHIKSPKTWQVEETMKGYAHYEFYKVASSSLSSSLQKSTEKKGDQISSQPYEWWKTVGREVEIQDI